MLHFYSLRECYRRVGIVPKQSHRSSPFNSKNLFILMGLFLMFISSLAYLLFEAKSIGKSADSIYMVLSSFVCVIIFLISIWKISTILELIEDYERFIEKSTFRVSIFFLFEWQNNHIKLNFCKPIRIGRFKLKGHVHRIDRENRTSIPANSNWCDQIDHSRCGCSSSFDNTHRFFRLWFRWRVILFAISSDVSLKNMQKTL